jgi:hypothetical protein
MLRDKKKTKMTNIVHHFSFGNTYNEKKLGWWVVARCPCSGLHNEKNHDNELLVCCHGFTGSNKTKGWQVAFIILVLEVNGMKKTTTWAQYSSLWFRMLQHKKKSHDDERNCLSWFWKYLWWKKTRTMSYNLSSWFRGLHNARKPQQWVVIHHHVFKSCNQKKIRTTICDHHLGFDSKGNEKKTTTMNIDHFHGFKCCNTRKKTKTMSLVSEVLELKKTQDNKL